MRDTEREAETWAEGEAGSCREPDMGHMQGTPGSHPGLKAVPNHCTTGAALPKCFKQLVVSGSPGGPEV